MTKSEFLDIYRTSKIRMIFDDNAFLQDNSISIVEERVTLKEMLDYFVPKFEKGGHFDRRDIQEQFADPETLPLTVAKASDDPAKWDLYSDKLLPIETLNPIPVATDLSTGKSLILDSNHTIVSLVSKLDPKSLESISIPVVRIVGNGLDSLSIGDFKILNRQ